MLCFDPPGYAQGTPITPTVLRGLMKLPRAGFRLSAHQSRTPWRRQTLQLGGGRARLTAITPGSSIARTARDSWKCVLFRKTSHSRQSSPPLGVEKLGDLIHATGLPVPVRLIRSTMPFLLLGLVSLTAAPQPCNNSRALTHYGSLNSIRGRCSPWSGLGSDS